MFNPSTVAPVRFSNGTPWRIDFNKNILVVRDSTVHARFYWTIICQWFEVAEPIHCRILAFLLPIHYFSLWLSPLNFNLEYFQCIACDVMKLCIKFERKSNNPRRSYCDFDIWPNDLEHVLRVAFGSGIIFEQVWSSTTYPCLNCSVFVMLMRNVKLWPWPLTLNFYSTSAQRKRAESSITYLILYEV